MSNIIASIINYTKNIWHNTDQDIVMAEHINAWENSIENKIQKIDQTSKTFREKVRHNLRTIWNRLIRLLKG